MSMINPPNCIEVVTSVQRRRRWTASEKVRMVEETFAPGMTGMVAKPEYRGTATGFAYVFVKLPAFLAIFLFPVLFSAIGQANATLFTALFPLAACWLRSSSSLRSTGSSRTSGEGRMESLRGRRYRTSL